MLPNININVVILKNNLMINRREFLSSLIRNIILFFLTALSGILIFKQVDANAKACDLDFICKNCKKLKTCNLNEAEAYKKENKN